MLQGWVGGTNWFGCGNGAGQSEREWVAAIRQWNSIRRESVEGCKATNLGG